MLLLVGLIDRLQAALKKPRKWHPQSSAGGSGGGGGDGGGDGGSEGDAVAASGEQGAPPTWVAPMRERLRRHDQLLLKELVSDVLSDFEQELLTAGDAAEMFDCMGILPEVLQQTADVDTWLGL